ncbi:MAG: type II toxin-antitoxin system VapC family toxin [Thermodesulfobacteriota bacterium]|nr:type II toxin-antitoxin system VapC family toxin [Thermodesulfobacteriota bacterium]
MTYLLDTNVISELRKAGSSKIDPNVERWAKLTTGSALFLSVITILELEMGVLLIERKDRIQGETLRGWFQNHVLPTFKDRILNIDHNVALRCAALHVPDRRSDRDALIAATALVHGMHVVTRNVTDFADTGVIIINPWIEIPY